MNIDDTTEAEEITVSQMLNVQGGVINQDKYYRYLIVTDNI